MIALNIAMTVENISKCYRIGVEEKTEKGMANTFRNILTSPLKNYRKYRSFYNFDDIDPDSDINSDTADIIWALKNISFQVKQGEVLGIIGSNGAGKSTLLKILSRITEPSRGIAKIRGKVSSLLEVGTGFNPELTGKENIYLNGTILGMKKAEIDRKLDEIIAFSGVEKFINTPVKRYSSGMSVRLAFAVAAHLEPEFLIVDEVLAVGDASFQKKCLGKMGEFAKSGRTILFVSHNMGAITDLCNKAIWLEEGRLKLEGPSMDVVNSYLDSAINGIDKWIAAEPAVDSRRRAWLQQARIVSNTEDASSVFKYDEQVRIEIRYVIKEIVREFRCYHMLRDSRGAILWGSHDDDERLRRGKTREPGQYISVCAIPRRLLRPGRYYVSVGIHGQPLEEVGEEHLDVISFDVSDVGCEFKCSGRIGILTPQLDWQITRKEKEENLVN
jgi:lipopolysaccharide transport system ATP-binding protein